MEDVKGWWCLSRDPCDEKGPAVWRLEEWSVAGRGTAGVSLDVRGQRGDQESRNTKGSGEEQEGAGQNGGQGLDWARILSHFLLGP